MNISQLTADKCLRKKQTLFMLLVEWVSSNKLFRCSTNPVNNDNDYKADEE